ncbi:hypothetical protein FNV43_RR19716 [Rhamnella rubrinervis]|uniref:Uncharacterized protein n=1 Tax=Rhamnella rubrinervis TaxID=2594499 RepID=A0A8K0GTY3_9ROSA|nr:hypothetical protein FNV43_RR19716 [Rhamnella rubrinervis]
MGGSGTSGNSQASYSITTSDSSTMKIKALFYFGRKPKFSEGDRKVRIAEGRLPHLVRLRNDISYEQFQKIICSLAPISRNFSYFDAISYYLPGHGLIALKTEEDMNNMIEEFDELNHIQEPQIFHIQQENVARSNDGEDIKCTIEEFIELNRIQDPQIFKMGGNGTLGNIQGSCSATASDSSTVKIKALLYFGCKPKLSESDGKLRIAEAESFV